jgi:hypothetical protein
LSSYLQGEFPQTINHQKFNARWVGNASFSAWAISDARGLQRTGQRIHSIRTFSGFGNCVASGLYVCCPVSMMLLSYPSYPGTPRVRKEKTVPRRTGDGLKNR